MSTNHQDNEVVGKPQGSMANRPGRRGLLPVAGQRLVGVDAAATMLGVSTNFAYGLIRNGDLPVVDLRKRTLVEIAEIDALIARSKRPK